MIAPADTEPAQSAEQNRSSGPSGMNLKPHVAHLRVRGSGVVMGALCNVV